MKKLPKNKTWLLKKFKKKQKILIEKREKLKKRKIISQKFKVIEPKNSESIPNCE